MPLTLCVVRSITTLFHTLNHSGWWFMASATRATRVILPKAATRSLHSYSRCSLLLTIFQPGNLGSRAWISASFSFFAGMMRSFGGLLGWRHHYDPRPNRRQDNATRSPVHGCLDRCGGMENGPALGRVVLREGQVTLGPLRSALNARANYI